MDNSFVSFWLSNVYLTSDSGAMQLTMWHMIWYCRTLDPYMIAYDLCGWQIFQSV